MRVATTMLEHGVASQVFVSYQKASGIRDLDKSAQSCKTKPGVY
ncbi:MAG TPA: hypothetical protein VNO24_07930 [Blastocatellia bacterium]|nr:hypothetical protein [Blastocatellia bacterium]